MSSINDVPPTEVKSDYSRIYDESNVNWEKQVGYNRLFLRNVENYLNELLQARGHVFLNEVYDRLGFDRTQEGAIVGWLANGDGANRVVIDITELNEVTTVVRPVYVLDFNVDGVIWNKI
jgi:hypothetical protein